MFYELAGKLILYIQVSFMAQRPLVFFYLLHNAYCPWSRAKSCRDGLFGMVSKLFGAQGSPSSDSLLNLLSPRF